MKGEVFGSCGEKKTIMIGNKIKDVRVGSIGC